MRYTKIIIISGENEIGLLAKIMAILTTYDLDVCDIGQSLILSSLSVGIMIQSNQDCFNKVTQDLKTISTISKVKCIDVNQRHTDKIQSVQSSYIITLMGRTLQASSMTKISHVLEEFGLDIQNIYRLSKNSHTSSDHICLEMTAIGEVADMSLLQRSLFIAGQEARLDIACQKDGLYRKNKRMVVFDMDSTLIKQEVIDELAKEAGVADKVAAITRQAMEGSIDFKNSLRERVCLLSGLKAEVCAKVYDNITLTPGATKLISTLKSIGYKTAIISGGFDYFSQRIKEQLGMDYHYANKLDIKNGVLTGKVSGTIIDGQRKAEIMCQLAKREGFSLEQVIAVGDGANDIPMLSIAGLGVSFHAKQKVTEQTQYNISLSGLDSILYMLGLEDR